MQQNRDQVDIDAVFPIESVVPAESRQTWGSVWIGSPRLLLNCAPMSSAFVPEAPGMRSVFASLRKKAAGLARVDLNCRTSSGVPAILGSDVGDNVCSSLQRFDA